MNLDQLCLKPDAPVSDAIRLLNDAPPQGLASGIVLIQGSGGALEGIVTDGDLRRAFAGGSSLTDPVSNIMNTEPVTFPDHLGNSDLFAKVMDHIQGARKEGKFRNNRMNTILCAGEGGHVTKAFNFIDLYRHTQMSHRPICVIGTGFVGLTLAVTLADCGYQVTGIDPSPAVHESLKGRKAHFHEKGLDPLIDRYLGNRLAIKAELDGPVGDVYIISVGTPVGDDDKKPILDTLIAATEAVAKVLKSGDLVILRSTVPVGTCRKVIAPILEKISGLKMAQDLHLAFAPERTIEGKALEELRSLPQVVGGWNDESLTLTADLFRQLTPTIINLASLEAAEMVKLVNNSYRDHCFAFANELAETCDGQGLDVNEVISAANNGYPRNPVPLPSPGVGGICLKKDPHIFAAARAEIGLEGALSREGRRTNEAVPVRLAAKVTRLAKEQGHESRSTPLLLCGLAFKGIPETSDIRESTAVDFLNELRKLGWSNIIAFDPVVANDVIAGLEITPVSLEEGFAKAPIACFMNNHPHWSNIDIFKLTEPMPRPGFILDTWASLVRSEVDQIEGLRYFGLSDPH